MLKRSFYKRRRVNYSPCGPYLQSSTVPPVRFSITWISPFDPAYCGRHYNDCAMNSRRLKTLKPAKQIGLCLAPLLLAMVAASAFAQASADDEVTPHVQAPYAHAKAAQQRGESVAATE